MNYVKLFKMSQLIIEYLMHTQDYLTVAMGKFEQEYNKMLSVSVNYAYLFINQLSYYAIKSFRLLTFWLNFILFFSPFTRI